jgi:hypothetical protein
MSSFIWEENVMLKRDGAALSNSRNKTKAALRRRTQRGKTGCPPKQARQTRHLSGIQMISTSGQRA